MLVLHFLLELSFSFQGYKHFDFVPQTFVIPSEYQDFCGRSDLAEFIW